MFEVELFIFSCCLLIYDIRVLFFRASFYWLYIDNLLYYYFELSVLNFRLEGFLLNWCLL